MDKADYEKLTTIDMMLNHYVSRKDRFQRELNTIADDMNRLLNKEIDSLKKEKEELLNKRD